MDDSPRVLVLSHNAFSRTQNNGKTLESFFDTWPKDKIAQLYLQPEEPDWQFSANYFQITDYEMLSRLLTRRVPGRVRITPSSSAGSSEIEPQLHPIVRRVYRARRGTRRKRSWLGEFIHRQFVDRRPIFVGLRELIWSGEDWASDMLREWVSDFGPDVLFFQGSSGVFGYNVALWLCTEFDIPLILQLTDDYTYRAHPFSAVEWLNNRRYLATFARGIDRSSAVIAISEAMEAEYGERFGGRYLVLMNSVAERRGLRRPDRGLTRRLLYAGNLGLQRWKSLVTIGEALVRVNAATGVEAYLDVYAPESTSEEVIAALVAVSSINFRGFVSSEVLQEEIAAADVLVHVESFSRRMRKVTRLSISTKIPEYLASSRPIFVLGPADIESVQYLKRNDAAAVVSEPTVQGVERVLRGLLTDTDAMDRYARAGLELYRRFHTSDAARRAIVNVVNDAIAEAPKDAD